MRHDLQCAWDYATTQMCVFMLLNFKFCHTAKANRIVAFKVVQKVVFCLFYFFTDAIFE